MTRDLSRMLKPRSIAVIGDAAWCRSVITGLRSIGYVWDVWPVHTTMARIAGIRAGPSVNDLAHAPDLALVGVRSADVVATLSDLSALGAGGAILASPLRDQAVDLKDAAGDMPVLGPECRRYINALDRVALWPGIAGWTYVPRGVAILTQDAVKVQGMTRGRALAIGYLAESGNTAMTEVTVLGAALLSDPRVTALGLDIAVIGDLRSFEALATTARNLGKPIVIRHALAADTTPAPRTGLDALVARLGMVRVESLDAFLETLKLLHAVGPLPASQIAALSGLRDAPGCIADAAARHGLVFAPLGDNQKLRLREVLGPEGMISNPLTLNKNIQDDDEALTDIFTQMMQGDAVLTLVVVDVGDDSLSRKAFEKMVTAAALAHAHVGMPLAIVTDRSGALPKAVALQMAKEGVIPMFGLTATMAAISAAITLGGIRAHPAPLLLPSEAARTGKKVRRVAGVQALAALGLNNSSADLDDRTDAEARIAIRILADADYGYLLIMGPADEGDVPKTGTPLLLPAARHDITGKLAKVLAEEDKSTDLVRDAALRAVLAVQDFVAAQSGSVAALALTLHVSHAGEATAREAIVEIAQDVQ